MNALSHRNREQREAEEDARLAPAGARSAQSRGRERDEAPDPLRTAYERDRDRILHSKAFRRLKHKTQVFIAPEGDHVVTRLTHTLNVAQVGRSLANALGCNESLTEAICLGHDLGHAPFGHTGEPALTPFMGTSEATGQPNEWLHAVQSVRIVRKLEPLNLTHEVRHDMFASSWRNDEPITAEGWICRYADRIAYLAHDAQDAMRAGVLRREQIPAEVIATFGEPGAPWISAMIAAVVDCSTQTGEVAMADDALQVMHALRDFMFQTVYLRPESKDQSRKAIRVIRDLVEHFADHTGDIPVGYALPDDPQVQQAVDYVAGMTDRYAIRTHETLFRPRGAF
ncbi:MAG: dGTPase [Glaciecola sp.]|jgi:dGTPase